eukprot:UN31487
MNYQTAVRGNHQRRRNNPNQPSRSFSPTHMPPIPQHSAKHLKRTPQSSSKISLYETQSSPNLQKSHFSKRTPLTSIHSTPVMRTPTNRNNLSHNSLPVPTNVGGSHSVGSPNNLVYSPNAGQLDLGAYSPGAYSPTSTVTNSTPISKQDNNN